MNPQKVKKFLLVKLIVSVVFFFITIGIFYFAVFCPISRAMGALG